MHMYVLALKASQIALVVFFAHKSSLGKKPSHLTYVSDISQIVLRKM